MKVQTKEVSCCRPDEVHSIPVNGDGEQVCGECGSWKLIYCGTAPVQIYVAGWCESHVYCKDCRHITWPGHFTGAYKDGKRLIGTWYTKRATEKQIERYEH